MNETHGLMHCVVGSRGSGRSFLVDVCVGDWKGSVVKVDLWAAPIESVAAWVPRLAESSSASVDWTMFRSAFLQFWGLVRGDDIDAQQLERMQSEAGDEEGLSSLIRFREALRFVEADMDDLRRQNGGPAVLVLDGAESLSQLAMNEIGRRGIAIFLEWLRRLALRGIANVILTLDGAFLLDFFVLPARVRDVVITSVPPLSGCDSVPRVYQNGALLAELRSAETFDSSVFSSRARYLSAFQWPVHVLRFAPLNYLRDQTEFWTKDEFASLIEAMLAEKFVSVEKAFSLMNPKLLLLLLRVELLDFVHLHGFCFPRIADRQACQALWEEGHLRSR